MKIYKLTDRVTIKIEGLTFKLAPLSWQKKAEIQALMVEGKHTEGSVMCVKECVKDVQGLETLAGEKYEIRLEDGVLSEESLNDIMNIEDSAKLMLACASLVNGIPKEIVHPVSGERIEGVQVVNPSKRGKKKSL